MEYKRSEIVRVFDAIEMSMLGLSVYREPKEIVEIPCVEFLIRAVRYLQSERDDDLRKSYRVIREHFRQYDHIAVQCVVENGFLEFVQLIPGESELHLEAFKLLYDVICGIPDDILVDYCDEQFMSKLWTICENDSFPLCQLHGLRCLSALARKNPEILTNFAVNVSEFICEMENDRVAYLDHHNCEQFTDGAPLQPAFAARISEEVRDVLSERSLYDWNDAFLSEANRRIGDVELLGSWANFGLEVKKAIDRELRILCFAVLKAFFHLDNFYPSHEIYTAVFRAIHSKQDPTVLTFALQCLCFSSMRDINSTMEGFVETSNHTELEKLSLIEDENIRHELVLFFDIVVHERYMDMPVELIIRSLSRLCIIHTSSAQALETTERALFLINDMMEFDGVCEMIIEFGTLAQLREMTLRGRFVVREKACVLMCLVLRNMTTSDILDFHQGGTIIDPLTALLESENETVIAAVLRTLGVLADAAIETDFASCLVSLTCNLPIPRLQEIIEEMVELAPAVYDLCAKLGVEL